MQYSLSTLHIELTKEDYQMLEEKLSRINKFLKQPYKIDILIRHDKHHLKGAVITCRINIEHRQHLFHAEQIASTVQNALDETLEAIKNELSRYHQLEHKN